MKKASITLSLVLLLTQESWARPSSPIQSMVQLPAGSYEPFFSPKDPRAKEKESRKSVVVESFWMDRYPVTNAQFLSFVKENPQWRKSRIKPIFSESHYLENWKSDLDFGSRANANSPVTKVSWFAANAYCKSQGKRLPTVDEWEYAANDRGKGTAQAKKRILSWYSQPTPNPLPPIGSAGSNGYGVHDLFGLVWEWTLDFNSAMVSEEARDNGPSDSNLFCGNGSQGALDAADYASFMRYSFRNSLKATYTVGNLGFRCAKEIQP